MFMMVTFGHHKSLSLHHAQFFNNLFGIFSVLRPKLKRVDVLLLSFPSLHYTPDFALFRLSNRL